MTITPQTIDRELYSDQFEEQHNLLQSGLNLSDEGSITGTKSRTEERQFTKTRKKVLPSNVRSTKMKGVGNRIARVRFGN